MLNKYINIRILEFMHRAVHNHTKQYQTDLLRDIETIARFRPSKVYWAAKECGTALVLPTECVPQEHQDINQIDAIVKMTHHQQESWYVLTDIFSDNANYDFLCLSAKKPINAWIELNKE